MIWRRCRECEVTWAGSAYCWCCDAAGQAYQPVTLMNPSRDSGET